MDSVETRSGPETLEPVQVGNYDPRNHNVRIERPPEALLLASSSAPKQPQSTSGHPGFHTQDGNEEDIRAVMPARLPRTWNRSRFRDDLDQWQANGDAPGEAPRHQVYAEIVRQRPWGPGAWRRRRTGQGRHRQPQQVIQKGDEKMFFNRSVNRDAFIGETVYRGPVFMNPHGLLFHRATKAGFMMICYMSNS